MASVLLASLGIELESDALNSLAFAALIILLMDASNLFDTSFQLSFAAVAAIVIFYAPIEKRLSFCPGWLASGALSVSTAAWIGITPFQIWHFGTIRAHCLDRQFIYSPFIRYHRCFRFGPGITAGLWAATIGMGAWQAA